MEYGQRLEPVVIAGVDGQRLELSRGAWHLLISGSVNDLALVKYLGRLVERPTIRTEVLRPLVLIDGHHDEVKAFEFRNFLPFPIHALHSFHHEELSSLGLRSHDRAYALVSPDLEVTFASTYLQPNDLRLLLEKHLGSGSEEHPYPLRLGDPFPKLALKQVAGRPAEQRQEVHRRLWIIFTAECVSCSLGNQTKSLAVAQAPLEDLARTEDSAVGVIFSSAFEESSLAARLDLLGLKSFPVYLASSPLYGLEDPYLRSSLHDADVVVVRVDPDGVVEEILDFSSWIRSMSAPQQVGS